MNLMYVVERDGWTVFHEGDSDSNPGSFRAVVDGGRKIDLSLTERFTLLSTPGQVIELRN